MLILLYKMSIAEGFKFCGLILVFGYENILRALRNGEPDIVWTSVFQAEKNQPGFISSRTISTEETLYNLNILFLWPDLITFNLLTRIYLRGLKAKTIKYETKDETRTILRYLITI